MNRSGGLGPFVSSAGGHFGDWRCLRIQGPKCRISLAARPVGAGDGASVGCVDFAAVRLGSQAVENLPAEPIQGFGIVRMCDPGTVEF